MEQTQLYGTDTPQRVSINSDLLPVQKSAKRKQEKWLEENQQVLEAYNQRVEKRGVFSDGLRTF